MSEPKSKEMRPLDDKERRTSEKNLKANKEELQSMTFAKHQAELMLNEGIQADIIQQTLRYKKQLSAVEAKIKELNFAIEVTEKQLKEGVEVKPPAELPTTLTVEVPDGVNSFDVQDKLEEMGCAVINKEVQ